MFSDAELTFKAFERTFKVIERTFKSFERRLNTDIKTFSSLCIRQKCDKSQKNRIEYVTER